MLADNQMVTGLLHQWTRWQSTLLRPLQVTLLRHLVDMGVARSGARCAGKLDDGIFLVRLTDMADVIWLYVNI